MPTAPADLVSWEVMEDLDAVESSIEVVRQKQVGDDAVVAVRYQRTSGALRQGMYGFRMREGVWRPRASFSGGVRGTDHEIWLHSGGWGDSTTHVRGGWVTEPAAARLRVTDPEDHVLEDDVQAGVAILILRGDGFDVRRATAELLDEHGGVLRTGPLLVRSRRP